MRSILSRGAAALALASLGLSAQAASVTLTGWQYPPGGAVSTTMHSGPAGAFTGSLSGAGAFDATLFNTYCVELTEFFSFGTTPMQNYAVVAGDTYFGATKAANLGRLLTFVNDNPARVDSAAKSTSMQLAIWNIVYDSDWSLTTPGLFRDTSGFAAYANTLLAGAQGIATSRYTVAALQKSGSQDFLLSARLPNSGLSAPVPEPASLALVALALGAAGVARRRREPLSPAGAAR